jgi:hypothetical protein
MSRGHAFGTTPFAWFARNAAPRTALSLSRCIQARIAEAAAAGLPWQAVLDDVPANARKLWDALDETEKRCLLRHLRTFWDSHRYRAAPQVEQAVAAKRADGSLRVLPASLRRVAREAGRIAVTLHPRLAPPETLLSFSVDTVIVTTGPAHGGVVAGNPVLASLAGAGLLRADALGLGIEVDEQSRVIGADGVAVPRMFVAGPLARARFGELMGLPQVAAQPNAVAEEIAGMMVRAEVTGGRFLSAIRRLQIEKSKPALSGAARKSPKPAATFAASAMRRILAGTPATVAPGGTGVMTTAPAAMRASSPISILPRIFAPAPIIVPRRTFGCRSPACLPVPPRVTFCRSETSSSTTAVSPTTRPVAWSRKTPEPMRAAGWMSVWKTSDDRLCK